jgi:hypothetical protein
MKKPLVPIVLLFLLIIALLLLVTRAYPWTGSDMTVTLKSPLGSGATTYMQLPTSIYGIVANGTSAVDYHTAVLYDSTEDVSLDPVTWAEAHNANIIFTNTVQDHNSLNYSRLLPGTLLKSNQSSGYASQYPPVQNGTYVKATSDGGADHKAYFSTDPTKSLTGEGTGNQWESVGLAQENQRFNIDLGSAKIITRIYYENSHAAGGNNPGTTTNAGVNNFTLWGSNSEVAFSDTVWISDVAMVAEGWTNLTTSQATFDQHVSLAQADPKYITVTGGSYRYYGFKFVDNFVAYPVMSIRRIELQTSTSVIASGIVKSGRRYVMFLRGRDIIGNETYDWGYVYFTPRRSEQ